MDTGVVGSEKGHGSNVLGALHVTRVIGFQFAILSLTRATTLYEVEEKNMSTGEAQTIEELTTAISTQGGFSDNLMQKQGDTTANYGQLQDRMHLNLLEYSWSGPLLRPVRS
ncbi:hypothetical protein AG1IA_06197 [Rhizoctonia solani AG-1 IA]|uniref:Uncharacterized protein n=1 Tax=Thanatephorus cucumeris (strain AG1-IA) TaxID=983506 RepID=L8WTY8_THACA|nr:hypothetical protein AG1IA_06197 [Rhizoctonia solani AG-1 IA]